MSWGTKIAIVYIGFVTMIGALIFRTSLENTDLEATDYYERELQFQEQIDGAEALLNSGEQPVVALKENAVNVQLPAALSNSPEGKVIFYRPDNAKLDREFALNQTSSDYSMDNFSAGTYRVRISWKDQGKDYFFETQIYLP